MSAGRREQATAQDPVTFSVVRNSLIAVVGTAFTAFRRTAMLPILYEGLDYAVSLYDDRLNLVAEEAAIPLFAGSLGDTVPRTVEEIGRDALRPGDVLLTNLPNLNGSHPADGILIEPIFSGGEMIAFIALRAHMGDLGAISFAPNATTEVFQEGLLLPPLKLYDGGHLREDIVRIISANSRIPRETSGDFLAGAGALRAGSAALENLVEKYGADTYRATVDGILDHGERIARRSIARIPDGSYRAIGALDDDGIRRGVPVHMEVTVTVAGGEILVDTTGSAPQLRAPFNCPWPYTQAVARMALKTLASPDIPSNSGEHRVLTLIAPEGSMFNPTPTAPSYSSSLTAHHLAELIIDALAPALPDEVPAMSGGDRTTVSTLLRRPDTGELAYNVYVGGAGLGAKRGADGANALYARTASGLLLVSAEVLETRHPILRHRCELDADSGGAGRWRGGLGMIEEHEYLSDGVATCTSDRTSGAAPVLGLDGGDGPKRLNGVIVYAGTDHELGPPSCKRSELEVHPGDRCIAWTAGGGGYGDPLERDPALVAEDVLDGYVSRESAGERYGVIFADGEAVDVKATQQRRHDLRAARIIAPR